MAYYGLRSSNLLLSVKMLRRNYFSKLLYLLILDHFIRSANFFFECAKRKARAKQDQIIFLAAQKKKRNCRSGTRTQYGRSQCFYRAPPQPIEHICIFVIPYQILLNLQGPASNWNRTNPLEASVLCSTI